MEATTFGNEGSDCEIRSCSSCSLLFRQVDISYILMILVI